MELKKSMSVIGMDTVWHIEQWVSRIISIQSFSNTFILKFHGTYKMNVNWYG